MDNEDPIEELLARIHASTSHVRADRDLALLARDELRPVRLLLEYLKPELALSDLGIEHTIVVFGSTRLLDGARPGPAFNGDHYYDIGRELGRIVGRYGRGPADSRLVVVTGGGPGAMEAANRGAHDVGAASMGLNITLPHEQEPNPYVTPELSFQFRYFALRKLHFMLRARALVALPGGFGTLDEVFETLCLIQTGKRPPLPVILIGEPFWRRAIDFDFLLEAEMIDEGDLGLFRFAETAHDAWHEILRWYEERDRSILDRQTDE